MTRRGCDIITIFLVIFLVIGSVPASGAAPTFDQSSDQAQTAAFGSSNWTLDISGAEGTETGSDSIGLNIGADLANQHTIAETVLDRLGLIQRFESVKTDDQRFQILITGTDRVQNRLNTLKQEERNALRARARSSISPNQYLKRMAAVSVQARALTETIDAIETQGVTIQSAEVQRRANGLRDRATELQDPVRIRTDEAIRGSADPLQVFIRSNPDGVVLTTIFDGEFVRTAIRYDHRSTDEPTTDLRTSLDEIYRIYPEATRDPEVLEAGGQRSVGFYYFLIAPNPDTTITTYLDNRNLTVFKETYQLSVDRIGLNDPLVASEDDIRLAVRQTYIGGPMRVRVTGSSVSDPVIATVRLNGSVVGETDADGELWVVEPDPPYTITSARGGREVTMNVSVPESQ